MRKNLFSRILTLTHIICAGIIGLNYLVDYFTKIRIVSNASVAIKLVFVISGIFLFFHYLKKNKAFHKYFGIFPVVVISSFLAYLAGGILSAIFLSIMVSPFQPNCIKYQRNELIFYRPFQGFMSRCCPLDVYETKFGLFEKKLFSIDAASTDFNPKEDIEVKSERLIVFKNLNSEFDVISQSYIQRDSVVSY